MKKLFTCLVIVTLVCALTITAFAEELSPAEQIGETLKASAVQMALELVKALVIACVGYVTLYVKSLAKKWLDSEEKRKIAKTCVEFVEQIYKDIHGQDKRNKAIEAANEILLSSGIAVGEQELWAIIEAAVLEMNKGIADKAE